ncbi:hypothetical protein BLA39750_00696 [Burkholderia lata]|uniref:Uncharacterized protein n=1 Tax=Burkholderia lata (strain ATCC 17760 / DSM 23089 / LMG 22485 / NCIMB 9086 / R18194 / 383) TaxID=482957 RepID=A0A6P2UM19_BURL3|nr:hypothetical protein BLA39750_00696 [Burkholderia lata]
MPKPRVAVALFHEAIGTLRPAVQLLRGRA